VTYPKRRLFAGLGSGVGLFTSSGIREIMEELKGNSLFADDPILLLMPYWIEIK
jgi:hypothetical protein